MYEWHKQIQLVIDHIDESIIKQEDDALTLHALAQRLGFSEYHMTRKFKNLAGLTFREYLRLRRLAFALIDIRDSKMPILKIAIAYGFSSHEAFTRAFKAAYGITPVMYRQKPVPLVLRTKINTFDRYILGIGEIGMIQSTKEIKIYFISIPAHKFLHIKNYESNGYFDFWEKQELIPDQDCHTICGLLDSIKGKLDGSQDVIGKFSGQIMARLYEDAGKGAEAYGIRLPLDYKGVVPKQMTLLDVPEAEYVVFEHGAFDYEQENETVGMKLAEAMELFHFERTEYRLDETAGRISYFYHDPACYAKWVKPIVKKCR